MSEFPITFELTGAAEIPVATTSTDGVMSATDKTKLDGIEANAAGDQTGSEIVTAINAALGVDLVTALQQSGSGFVTASQVIAAIDATLTGAGEPTEMDPAWRRKFVPSVFGRDGDVEAESGDYTLTELPDVQTALDSKAPVSHSHVIGDVTDLSTTLAAKADLVSGKVPVAQLPDGIGAVASVNTQTGAVVLDLDDIAETSTNKLFTATEKTKLSLIEAEATADMTPAEIVAAIDDALGSEDWQNGGGETKTFTVPLIYQLGSLVWSDIPSAETVQFSGASNRPFIMDLSDAAQVNFFSRVTSAGSSGTIVNLRYSTDAGNNFTTISGINMPLDATGYILGTWVDVPTAAKTAATVIEVVTSGGNGTADATIVNPLALVRYVVGAGGGGSMTGTAIVSAINSELAQSDWQEGEMTGGEIVSAINTQLGGTDWQTGGTGGIADNAVTNAKLADVATGTLKGRVTAATGDPEDLTASQVRTLLNVSDGANTAGVTGDAFASSHAGSGGSAHAAASASVAGFMTATQFRDVSRLSKTARYTSSATIGLTEWSALFFNTAPVTATLRSDLGETPLSVSNHGSATVTIVPSSGQTLRGGNIVLVAGTDTEPSTVCLVRDPVDASWRLN